MQKSISKFTINLIISIFLTLGLSISFQSLLAQTWSAPTDNPPDGMVGTGFVTLTNLAQTKTGKLTVNGLESTNGFISVGGMQTDNLIVLGDVTTSRLNVSSNQSDGTWLLLTGDNMGFIAMQAYSNPPHNGVMYFDRRGDFIIASQSNNAKATEGDKTDRLIIKGDTGNVWMNSICDISGGNCKNVASLATNDLILITEESVEYTDPTPDNGGENYISCNTKKPISCGTKKSTINGDEDSIGCYLDLANNRCVIWVDTDGGLDTITGYCYCL